MNAKTKETSKKAQKINDFPRFVGFGDTYWQRGYLSLILGTEQFSIKEKKAMVGFQVEGQQNQRCQREKELGRLEKLKEVPDDCLTVKGVPEVRQRGQF